MANADVIDLEPSLILQLWEYLSPARPKYHVEAVKLIWQLYDLLAPDESLHSDGCGMIRDTFAAKVCKLHDLLPDTTGAP